VAIGSGWFAVSSILSYGSKMANTAAAAAGVPSDTAGSSAVARPPGAPGVSGPGVRAPLSTDEWLALRVERIKGLPQTMPIYDDVTRPTVARIRLHACICPVPASATRNRPRLCKSPASCVYRSSSTAISLTGARSNRASMRRVLSLCTVSL